MSKRIRVKEDTHTTLAALKGDDKTFDELLSQFISERRETIQRGAGLWADIDVAEKARATRGNETTRRHSMTLYDSSILIDYLHHS